MNRTEDRLLIGRLQARDETAVHARAERYGARIYQLALRQMKNPEDAEEVTQDVLMKVYRKIDAFRGDAALSSWIYRITFNTAMSRLRTARAARAADRQKADINTVGEESPRQPQEPADWSALADDHVLRGEMRKQLIASLTHLPTVYRVP